MSERIYNIIAKKRDGKVLTKEDLSIFITSYVNGDMTDYQAAALLMAIYINGMTDEETFDLTQAMTDSGTRLDLSKVKGIKVDKHSTGGVGDKTTLVAAPIAAACGVKIAKMSGRGLGYTGGTIDKLESIPGLRTDFEIDDIISLVNKTGLCIVGQTGKLAPADKKIYALRDATATIGSIPLIASSIMSKKIAAGSDAILLDVKVGSGTFMKTIENARILSKEMIKIGEAAGRKMAVIISNMDVPLGYNIGNSLEVAEAIKTLKCKGPKDLTDICIQIAANMIYLAEIADREESLIMARKALESGAAFTIFRNFIEAQDGDVQYIDNPEALGIAKLALEVTARKSGYITKMDTEKFGEVSVLLGAGRVKKEDKVDISAGIVLAKKTGDYVEKGETIATFFTNDESSFGRAENDFSASLTIEDTPPEESVIIFEKIGL